jgi:hypothetical protein
MRSFFAASASERLQEYMERRVMLIGLAATLTATQAGSQTLPQPTARSAPDGAFRAATDHIKKTLAAGSLALATRRIAAPKVKSEALKQFVKFEIAEQETIATVLNALTMPDSPPPLEAKAPSDAELAGNIDPKDWRWWRSFAP